MRTQILLPVKQPDLEGGKKMSFGYSLLQNKALMEGRLLVTALPMQAELCSPMGVPVDAPQLTGRQLDHPCPLKAS